MIGCEKDPENADENILTSGVIADSQQDLSNVPGYVPPSGGPSAGLPQSYDLSPFMPPVGNQGSQGSCVGWTIGYYLQSYHQKVENNYSYSDNSKLMSPSYLYNLGNSAVISGTGNCMNVGAAFIPILDILKNQGVATLQDFPYDQTNCSNTPSPNLNSYENRIDGYSAMFNDYTPSISDQNRIFFTKASISQDIPVIIGYWIDNVWANQQYNPNTEVIYYSHSTNPNPGRHASLVVGYDNSKNAFKVINSWGTTWGNGGYFWIDYDFFTEIVYSAFATEDYVSPNTTNISSEFSASTPTTISVNQNVSFVDESSGNPTSWLWSFQGGNPTTSTNQNPTVTYTIPGTYLVSLKVTTSNGDTDTEIKQGYVTVNSNSGNAPVANFIGTPTTISAGQSVQFTDLSTNSPTGWQWNFSGGTTSSLNTQNPVVVYSNPGTYTVSLLASNSFGDDIEEKTAYITVSSSTPAGCEGTFIDSRDGQEYCYVTIGNQVWMSENLNYDAGAGSWCYDQTNYYCNQYGRFYDWNTLMNGSAATNQSPSGVQGVCPNGWHVPSRYELQELLDNYPSALGNAAYAALIDGGVSNFDMKLGGDLDIFTSTLNFYNLTYGTGIWSASDYNASGSQHYYLDFYSNKAILMASTNNAFYCRCVQD